MAIRYFSMFTGVGGFELGIEASSNGNAKRHSEETSVRDSNRDKSISKRHEESNNPTDNREATNSQDTDGALLQNRSEQSNTQSNHLESPKEDTQPRQPIRQTSNGVLREGDGVRDDKTSLQLREDKPNHIKFECVGFSEIDKYANELLANKFPNTKNFGDCTKINTDELPDFDLLCGGFPCQSFSIAGKRRGFEDTRGTMFFEIARILTAKRPKTLLLENVKGLLNHNKGETFKVILEALDELGYDVEWMVLNSKFFGVPQNRERVFIIGSLRGDPRPEILPFGEIGKTFDESKVSHTLPSSYYKITRGTTFIHNIYGGFGEGIRQSNISPTIRTPKGGGHLPMIAQAVLTPDRPNKRQNGRRIKEDGEPSFTLTGQDIHGVSNGMMIRKLTPLECERLQGFPDGWTEGFSDTQRYKMMGNAVTVNVIEAIMEKFRENREARDDRSDREDQ